MRDLRYGHGAPLGEHMQIEAALVSIDGVGAAPLAFGWQVVILRYLTDVQGYRLRCIHAFLLPLLFGDSGV